MSDQLHTAGTAAREAAVAGTFVELADTLVPDYDVHAVLDRLVRTCVALLDVQAAGMLFDDQAGGLAVAAASSDEVRVLELLQVQHADGPCRDCALGGQVVESADLDEEARWPVFTPRAARSGLRAVTAVPLGLRGETVGALGLFREGPGLLAPAERALAQAFADVATIGVLQQRRLQSATLLGEQLREALESRVVIEQAKGVVAERQQVSVAQAFGMLRKHARDHNEKLSQVALAVVEGRLQLRA